MKNYKAIVSSTGSSNGVGRVCKLTMLVLGLGSLYCVPSRADTLYGVYFDFTIPSTSTTLQSTPELACDAYKSVFAKYIPTRMDPSWVLLAVNSSAPNDGGCFVDFAIKNIYSGAVIEHDTISSSGNFYVTTNAYFVATPPITQAQCDACNSNSIGHPINPASGATFDAIGDAESISTSLPFNRFYNSTDSGSTRLSGGWRYSFSRNVAINYSTIATQSYLASAATSSRYSDPANTCSSGFAEIQAQVSQWSGALASYSGGNCQLTKNGISIGSLTVYTTGGGLAQGATPVAFDVIRDDGQLIRFIVNNGAITPPPGISLQLTQVASGFTITDASNNVEQYDTNGRLLSATSRSGVVQTMSYDAAGRLSNVADSFGHQLMLSYDAQGHLITVTRQ